MDHLLKCFSYGGHSLPDPVHEADKGVVEWLMSLLESMYFVEYTLLSYKCYHYYTILYYAVKNVGVSFDCKILPYFIFVKFCFHTHVREINLKNSFLIFQKYLIK